MALFPASSMGGLTKASSWADAKAKAKSYAIVKIEGLFSVTRVLELIIPKEDFNSSNYFTTGYYYTASNNGMVTFKPDADTAYAYFNGGNVSASSMTVTFYYD